MNVPNLITLSRLMSVPLMIWLIVGSEFAVAFWVFIAAGISDALDGFIAKRFDCRTRLGALLDPAADKALISSVYVALGIAEMLPNWLVILVVFRDVTIIGGFILFQTIAVPRNFDPLYISKINTAMQIALVGYVLGRSGLGLPDGGPTGVLVIATAATTVLSGFSYLIRWARILAGAEPAT
ncbi:MAG: CDP-alcohol phosphatidyltransferase family protein [Alphaproteobacteria bacterium]|nr:CDP-alcohol phosphatidyltransferase family protein [Alphaproteobacteria bacterium]MBV9555268.1 CDP-alcohol phosphatidyltransferase family protein [Alphaproteobacteria bacterium]